MRRQQQQQHAAGGVRALPSPPPAPFAVMALLALALPARALVIDPLRTELQAPPGTTLHGSITLVNEKDEPVRLAVDVRNLSRSAGGNWLVLDATSLDLPAGGEAALAYTITIPEDARGSLLGRVGFVESGTEGQAAVSIRTKISVPVYVIVEGTEEYAAAIADVRCLATDPVKIECAVYNAGNVHVRARGECAIADESGRTFINFPVNDQGFPLYPGRTNRVLGSTSHRLGPGTYTATVKMPFPNEQHLLSRSIPIHVAEEPR